MKRLKSCKWPRHLALLGAGSVALAVFARRRKGVAPDVAWWHEGGPPLPKARVEVTRSSQLLKVRDGVSLAIDVYLPVDFQPGSSFPTVLHQTRYFRRARFKPRFVRLQSVVSRRLPEIKRFVDAGYAYILVDARGSGASFGHRTSEWSREEVADGADVADWIVTQPWSDGRIVTHGVSYEGTCAEQLIRNAHSAVVASVPRYALFDCFADIFAPGGLRGSWFIPLWAALNQAKDRNDQERFLSERGAGIVKALAYLTEGVSRVDEDFDGSLVDQAVRDHQANYDLVTASAQVEFRDDVLQDGTTLDDISPHTYLDELRASGAAVYSWGGWYDGAYTEAAVKRFLALRDRGARLILGPWDHGGVQLPDPTTDHRKSAFDEPGEIIRFFDSQLDRDGTGFDREPPVHYYTVGDVWKSAHQWPPPGFSHTPFYFAEGNYLSASLPAEDGQDIYRVYTRATSGLNTRWHTQVNIWGRRIRYPDRAEQDRKLLVYDSDPLPGDAEVTGHPIVILQVASTTDDGSFHVYLEEVTSAGAVRYVTEGVFRAINRRIGEDPPEWERTVPYHTFLRQDALPLVPGEIAEISFGLQPISYLFRTGSRIRVAIAGADADNFVCIPSDPPTLSIQRSVTHPSQLLLPLASR